MTYGISVLKVSNGDLVRYEIALSATEMEDAVTDLHREFPAPTFRTDVNAVR
ncbi:hypothetical protein ACFY1A_17190 [Streptomyces sp. NPDC001520]|uniref:hypothetical protein n=1 Tax=Streptomyces sp. NPDC001520 TaxID=3364581 RepID=UPI003687BB0E